MHKLTPLLLVSFWSACLIACATEKPHVSVYDYADHLSDMSEQVRLDIGELDLNVTGKEMVIVKGLPEGWYSLGLLTEDLPKLDQSFKQYFGAAIVEMKVTGVLANRLVDVQVSAKSAIPLNYASKNESGAYIVVMPVPICSEEVLIDYKKCGEEWRYDPGEWEHVPEAATNFFHALKGHSYTIRCEVLHRAGTAGPTRVKLELRRQKGGYWKTMMNLIQGG
jgi:hypothetical protein